MAAPTDHLDFDACKGWDELPELFRRELKADPWTLWDHYLHPDHYANWNNAIKNHGHAALAPFMRDPDTLSTDPRFSYMAAWIPTLYSRWGNNFCARSLRDQRTRLHLRGMGDRGPWDPGHNLGQSRDDLLKRTAELKAEAQAREAAALNTVQAQACAEVLRELGAAKPALDGSNPNSAEGKQNIRNNLVGRGYLRAMQKAAACDCADLEHIKRALYPKSDGGRDRHGYLREVDSSYRIATDLIESKLARCNQASETAASGGGGGRGGGSKSIAGAINGKVAIAAVIGVVILVLLVRK